MSVERGTLLLWAENLSTAMRTDNFKTIGITIDQIRNAAIVPSTNSELAALNEIDHLRQPPTAQTVQTAQDAMDIQVGGDHYKNLAIQPVEFCFRNKIPAIESSIIEYAIRWRKKGGYADLKKIKHYCDLLMQLDSNEGIDASPNKL